MLDKSPALIDVGARLRDERQRLEMDAAAMGAIGGVNRNSQGEYEAGKRPCSLAYLLAIAEAGVDLQFVLSGQRASGSISRSEAEWLEVFRLLPEADQLALLQIVRSITGRAPSQRIHSPEVAYRGEAG